MTETSNSSPNAVNLATKSEDIIPSALEDGAAFVQLGGVKVFAPDETYLKMCSELVSSSIIENANKQVCTDMKYLQVLCKEQVIVGQRIFRAFLNKSARLGEIDFLLCRSETGKTFKLVVAAQKADELRSILAATISAFQSSDVVRVKDVQAMFFADQKKGAWFVASNVLQRLAYLGLLTQVDKWTFRVPEALRRARTDFDEQLFAAHPCRLA